MKERSEQAWTLPSDATAALHARELIAAECVDLRREQSEVAILLVSELVGNAVSHGAGTVVLHLIRDEHRLRVEVQDESPETPVMAGVRSWAEMENGAGLRLVDALATDWGVTHEDAALSGKRVWFSCE